MDKTGVTPLIGENNIVEHMDAAIIRAAEIVGEEPIMCPVS
jgi:hypothetical protein